MSNDSIPWADALDRAGELAAWSVTATEPESWDTVATRGLIAIAVYCVAARTTRAVSEVPLAELLVPLIDGEQLTALVNSVLASTEHTQDAGPDDPVAAQWTWLHRSWDPDAAPGRRWDGLPRGIGWGLREPAIVVCLGWAASAVSQALTAQRGGLPSATSVDIVAGEDAGSQGRVEQPAWTLDDTGTAVAPGVPDAYLVTVRRVDGPKVTQLLRTQLDPREPDR